MVDFELKKVGAWVVTVDNFGTFTASKKVLGEEEPRCLHAKLLVDLEELIKRQESNDRHFKPLNVIEVASDKCGRLTSFVGDDSNRVYFTFKQTDGGLTRRTEETLSDHWRDHKNNFVLANESNLTILKMIEETDAKIEGLKKEMEDLKKHYTDPVTEEMLKKGDR